jgi:hypothetical protein
VVPVSLPMRCRRVPAPFTYKNEGWTSLLRLRNLNAAPTSRSGRLFELDSADTPSQPTRNERTQRAASGHVALLLLSDPAEEPRRCKHAEALVDTTHTAGARYTDRRGLTLPCLPLVSEGWQRDVGRHRPARVYRDRERYPQFQLFTVILLPQYAMHS